MKKALFSLILLSGLIISCNNTAKEEKTEKKDTIVAPVTPPDSTTHTGDSTGKGEQAPPPKTN